MVLENFIRNEFIALELDLQTKEEVVLCLGSMLLSAGYVKDSFINAVLEREKMFPTGLATQDVHVAIPHTDVEHCLKPGIAIGLLKTPVVFTEMASTDQQVNVEMVFLLSITEPTQQVIWLSRLATLFQTPYVLKKLMSLSDPELFRVLFTTELKKAKA